MCGRRATHDAGCSEDQNAHRHMLAMGAEVSG
jgi:hypothetical protein